MLFTIREAELTTKVVWGLSGLVGACEMNPEKVKKLSIRKAANSHFDTKFL